MNTISRRRLTLAAAWVCLQVLFFAGPGNQHGDSHDVAVALREVLKEYPTGINAALVERADEAELQPRFRVLVLPSMGNDLFHFC